jgi:hypothetical protein
MKKANPIELLTERIDRLANQKYLFYDEVINYDYSYIKEKIYEYCEKQNNKTELKVLFDQKISDNLNKLLGNINEVVSRVKQRVPVENPRYLLNHMGGIPLSKEDQSQINNFLISELECYCLAIEVIIGKKIDRRERLIIPERPKANSGRTRQVPCFKGDKKLSIKQLNVLFDLPIRYRTKSQLFIDCKEARQQFIEIMNSDDVSEFAGRNYKILIESENYILAFVFTWLEKNNFIKHSFLSIERSESFFSMKATPLKADDLRKAKSTYEIEKYITIDHKVKKGSHNPPQNPDDIKQYLPFLNSCLHEIFNVK